MTDENLCEELLNGWLAMSLSISNERLVSAMTYHESMVCHMLYRQDREGFPPMNATELCGRLQIQKPQMNVILNRMEKEGLIDRTRSMVDKRNVELRLTDKGVSRYVDAHREILRIPAALIERLGKQKAADYAAMMKEVAFCFHDMMQKKKKEVDSVQDH